jgi:hypothetical protein
LTEIRFLIREGVTRMFLRCKSEEEDVGIVVEAVCVTGSRAPFPTVTKVEKGRGEGDDRVPDADDMCDEAPVSRYHSLAAVFSAV